MMYNLPPQFNRVLLIGIATAVVAALPGCGGSGGGNGLASNPPATSKLQFGPLSTTSNGLAQPPVTSAGVGCTVTGIAGTQFNDVTLNPPSIKDLAHTLIAFSGSTSTVDQLYTMTGDGRNVTQITTSGGINPSWSPDGSKLVFLNQVNQVNQVFTVGSTGGQPTAVTTDLAQKFQPKFSPDGTKILFIKQGDVVSISNGVTTQLTHSTSTSGITGYAISPDGTKLLVEQSDVAQVIQLFVTPITSWNPVQLTYTGQDKFFESWSPDGTKISYNSTDANSVMQVYVMTASGHSATALTSGTSGGYCATWAPDGSKLAYNAIDSHQVQQIFEVSAQGGAPTELTFGTAQANKPAWSTYLTSSAQKLVGTSGSMGTAAAGLIVSESGQQLNSLLVFDTAHPTTASRALARVTAQSGSGNQMPTNLVFTLTTGDSLSSLKYVNGIGNTITSVIGSGGSVTGATSAIVSFDGTTGLVALVMTYSATRGASLQPNARGDELTYNRPFSAVFDGNGKNLAPNGASSVTINSKSGQLVRLQ